jgi:hypothetical protein
MIERRKLPEGKFLDFLNRYKKDPKRLIETADKEIANFKRNETCRDDINREMLDEYVFNFIKEHKNINFVILVPPYSKYFIFKNNLMCRYDTLLRYAVSNASDNMTIYAFDNMVWTEDLNLYTERDDFMHYNSEVDSMILQAIKEKTNIIDRENIEKYLDEVRKEIDKYSIEEFKKEVGKIINDKL